MAMKNHKVELAGNGFVIKSDVSDVRIREIEAILNEKLDRTGGKGQRIAFTDSLVLVLFHITDLMLDAESSSDRIRHDTADRVRSLRSEIEELQDMVKERLAAAEDTIS
jgi:hypothetical protein